MNILAAANKHVIFYCHHHFTKPTLNTSRVLTNTLLISTWISILIYYLWLRVFWVFMTYFIQSTWHKILQNDTDVLSCIWPPSQHSPVKSYTNRCETELGTSCHSWWQAPSPDCIAADCVGFPLPAGRRRREHRHRPSRTPWREAETGHTERETRQQRRTGLVSGLSAAFIFENISINLWCTTYGSSCGRFPSESEPLTVAVSADSHMNPTNLQQVADPSGPY